MVAGKSQCRANGLAGEEKRGEEGWIYVRDCLEASNSEGGKCFLRVVGSR